jgi:ABC-type lipoprotein release transport system permease subunit
MRTMIWSIAWKNVWRNKTRSVVVIVAVMLGIFGGTMATGIMQGWIALRIHDAIYIESGHIQVHNPEYMFNEELRHTIINYKEVVSTIDTMKDVIAWSPRVKMVVMAQSDWAASALILKGIDTELENRVSELNKTIIEGNFLEKKHKVPSIVIGSKAAETLKLLNYQVTTEKLDSIDTELYPPRVISKLNDFGIKRYRKENDFRKALEKKLDKKEYYKYGDGLVKYFSFYRLGIPVKLTVQNNKGELVSPVFKVRGIYKTSNSMYDAMNAFVERDVLNQVTGLNENEVHEIGIITTNNETGLLVSEKLAKYSPANNVMSWRKLSPEIAMFTDFANTIGYIYVIIILLALAFGIINTMMMSVLERVKELGMLMAIGMNKKRVFTMIMLESVFLAVTGAFMGLIVSGTLLEITSRTGINLGIWTEGLEALGYSAVIFPIMTAGNYLGILFLVIVTGIAASIWPARKALRLKPVEALRTE